MNSPSTTAESPRVSIQGADAPPPLDPTAVSVLGNADTPTVSDRATMSRIEGVEIHPIHPYTDPRGILVEVVDFTLPFWREPIVFSYTFSINPGRIKGWAMHMHQADRQYVHCGNVRFALFDARTDSPTHGQVWALSIGDDSRALLRIPPGVWHAAQCWGDVPAHVTNFPTIPYNHERPDKQTLPLDTDLIPFDFHDMDVYPR